MEGFESQYRLETLAIAHWVNQDDLQAGASFEKALAKLDEVTAKVQDWSPRQRELIKIQHVRKTWQRLHE